MNSALSVNLPRTIPLFEPFLKSLDTSSESSRIWGMDMAEKADVKPDVKPDVALLWVGADSCLESL